MKFIITLLILTLLYRQRYRALRAIRYVIAAIDAVRTAWKNM